MFSRQVVSLIVFLSLTFCAPLLRADTKETMHLVYAALTELLPLALNADGFEDDETRNRMTTSLDLLERSAVELESHAGGMEFRSLARSFHSNVVLLKNTLRFDRIYEFNYLALDLTQNCISCHARLPESRVMDFSSNLTDKVAEQLVSPVDLAQLQIATRQFDGALNTLSEMILDPAIEPVDLELQGVLFDYLLVAVTRADFLEPALKVLDDFTARPDAPYYMKHYARTWADHLKGLSARVGKESGVEFGRALFDESLNLSPLPTSQVRLVYDLMAAQVLRGALDSGTELSNLQKAEIYWMLAAISIRSVNPRPGVPHTELLLDAAIRNAPGSEFAKDAYAILEEYNRVSFAGIPVAELPEPVLDLEALKRLAGIE